MNITVYLASRMGADPDFEKRTRELGKWIGENGHTLVYGGSDGGLMGVLADAALAGGGRIIGVEPDVQLILDRQHKGLSEVIKTDSMAERKTVMIEKGDMFIALPGGLGTLDEITEVLDLKSLDLVKGPVVFFNVNGCYTALKQVFDSMLKNGLAEASYFADVHFADTVEDIRRIAER